MKKLKFKSLGSMPLNWTCILNHFSCVQFCATPWTVAHQALLSMEFSRQEYWSGLPCLPPGDLPDPGIEPVSLMSPTLAGGFFITSARGQNVSRLFYGDFEDSNHFL